MDVVAIVFHSDGLLFTQGEVGSGTPVEVVVVAVLAVEGGRGDVVGGVIACIISSIIACLVAAYVIRSDVLFFPYPLPVGVTKLGVVRHLATGVGKVEVVVVAHVPAHGYLSHGIRPSEHPKICISPTRYPCRTTLRHLWRLGQPTHRALGFKACSSPLR